MRIIGGSAAGTILKAPRGFEVRPTPDLVRQAVFNSLAPRLAGAGVLELFGGTGALSLECLSRGAAHAVCVEKSGRHAQFIRQNLELARLPSGLLDLRVQDAFAAIAPIGRRESTIRSDFRRPALRRKEHGPPLHLLRPATAGRRRACPRWLLPAACSSWATPGATP